jgi:hypothetical protein
LQIRIGIIFGSWVRIRFKVKIQELLRLKMERKAVKMEAWRLKMEACGGSSGRRFCSVFTLMWNRIRIRSWIRIKVIRIRNPGKREVKKTAKPMGREARQEQSEGRDEF